MASFAPKQPLFPANWPRPVPCGGSFQGLASAIVRVSTFAICGSDLHLFDGFMPTMESGDIQPDDTVAIWGAGPVGQMANRSAVLLGAHQVLKP